MSFNQSRDQHAAGLYNYHGRCLPVPGQLCLTGSVQHVAITITTPYITAENVILLLYYIFHYL